MNQYIGRQLGAYRLIRPLGSGGFAEVYLGKHVQNNWEVAVKILKIHYSAETFRQEANTLWHLRHPHIVEIKEFNTENDGTSYLIMDYAARGSLRDVHPVGEILLQPQILIYVKQIADALDFMHNKQAKPLVHCDIKPQNFLMKENRDVLLGDFGIATEAVTTSLRLASLPSSPKSIVGTLHYIAPEQWQGQSPTPATDQYALGVVVYEWLSGKRPFTGTNPQLIAQAHIYNAPPPFNDNTISAELEDAVTRAMAKDPGDRFPTILAFTQALEDAIQHRPIFAPQQGQNQNAPQNTMGSGIWGQLQPQTPFITPVPGGEHNAPTIPATPQQMAQLYPQNTDPFGLSSNIYNTSRDQRRRPQRRRPPIFEWGNLQETNSRLFLVIGGIVDLLSAIPLFLWFHDPNWAFGLPLLAIVVRLFCAAADKQTIALPLAWVLTLYETIIIFGLLFQFYVLAIVLAIVAWLGNDFFYARKK